MKFDDIFAAAISGRIPIAGDKGATTVRHGRTGARAATPEVERLRHGCGWHDRQNLKLLSYCCPIGIHAQYPQHVWSDMIGSLFR
jgi:hypothetical protein